jgi:peroxiredoxin
MSTPSGANNRNKSIALAGSISGVMVLGLLLWHKPSIPPAVVWTTSEQMTLTLPIGAEAPGFALPTSQGETVQLADLRGRRTGLIFVTASCPYCAKLEDSLEVVGPPQDRQLLIICNGSRTDALKIEGAHSLAVPVLIDSGGVLSKTYLVKGVPQVYLLDEKGYIESIANGMPNAWEAVGG